ncbi:hypothetical protein [Kozakia baliensis]|uniref:hypothetical protein n=1 Tax=Kozakia baliensis TaxID=153496 RepID=UPI00116A7D85|nr:hypothetical protein [Kozakia baliensis]GBR28315.1 hypothetical protein AA0488_1381 [Kozakia baliensis NRIC 0488]GEL63718.1 hypothetical protein KBA01_10040 [Kozakia baliensis]
MPLTFVLVIGLALFGLLALVAPHYSGLSFTMAALYSIGIIPVGIMEALRNRKLD